MSRSLQQILLETARLRLRRSAWGAGLATEGASALVEAAVSGYGIERICARTLLGNAASRRVMEKCGFELADYFTYPQDLLPGWSEAERRAVKYVLQRGVLKADCRRTQSVADRS